MAERPFIVNSVKLWGLVFGASARRDFAKHTGQELGVGTWGPVAPSPVKLDCTGDAAIDAGKTTPMVAPPPRRGV